MQASLSYRLLDRLGINALFRFMNRNRYLIIMYHGVAGDDFHLLAGYDERHIRVSAFREQMQHLQKCGYRFVTLGEAARDIAAGRKARRTAVITFDDGFRDVIVNAYPLLRDMQVPACFYLISGLLQGDAVQWTDHLETLIRERAPEPFDLDVAGETVTYDLGTTSQAEHAMRDAKRRLRDLPGEQMQEAIDRLLAMPVEYPPSEFRLAGEEELRALDRDILYFGAHSRTHRNLRNLTDDELQAEVSGSRNDLEARFGGSIPHFCYPAGAYDDRTVAAVRAAGCETAVTTDLGLNDPGADVLRLKRVYSNESLHWFKAVTSGSYFFSSRIKSAIKRMLGGRS